MDNEEIARRFNRMASLMEVRGEDAFRIRSYRMAAEAIETWPMPMKEIVDQDGAAGLQEIPGVGKAIAGKIVELLDRGTFDAWEKLTAETPATVLDLLELPGVEEDGMRVEGAKKAGDRALVEGLLAMRGDLAVGLGQVRIA